jgi:hypothetical protein
MFSWLSFAYPAVKKKETQTTERKPQKLQAAKSQSIRQLLAVSYRISGPVSIQKTRASRQSSPLFFSSTGFYEPLPTKTLQPTTKRDMEQSHTSEAICNHIKPH